MASEVMYGEDEEEGDNDEDEEAEEEENLITNKDNFFLYF